MGKQVHDCREDTDGCRRNRATKWSSETCNRTSTIRNRRRQNNRFIKIRILERRDRQTGRGGTNDIQTTDPLQQRPVERLNASTETAV